MSFILGIGLAHVSTSIGSGFRSCLYLYWFRSCFFLFLAVILFLGMGLVLVVSTVTSLDAFWGFCKNPCCSFLCLYYGFNIRMWLGYGSRLLSSCVFLYWYWMGLVLFWQGLRLVQVFVCIVSDFNLCCIVLDLPLVDDLLMAFMTGLINVQALYFRTVMVLGVGGTYNPLWTWSEEWTVIGPNQAPVTFNGLKLPPPQE